MDELKSTPEQKDTNAVLKDCPGKNIEQCYIPLPPWVNELSFRHWCSTVHTIQEVMKAYKTISQSCFEQK